MLTAQFLQVFYSCKEFLQRISGYSLLLFLQKNTPINPPGIYGRLVCLRIMPTKFLFCFCLFLKKHGFTGRLERFRQTKCLYFFVCQFTRKTTRFVWLIFMICCIHRLHKSHILLIHILIPAINTFCKCYFRFSFLQ